MSKKERYIVGLDIGTTKVTAIVSEVTEEGGLDVIGIGSTESKGLRKGTVINLEQTVDSIKRVVEEAELMAGVEIESAYVGLAGSHIKGFNSRAVVAITNKTRFPRSPIIFQFCYVNKVVARAGYGKAVTWT